MKKILAFVLASVMSVSCAAAVQANGRIEGIYDAVSGRDEIHIIYNDDVVEYEDVKPVNTDGRVMIPFRAALENMGATVDYSDIDRKVTATKGNITITFTLMDDTIYINNNGQQSTITMDVPMIIVDDRTLVPIRFMSNAFGMQVGWDGDTQTVVIMDYDDYFDDFAQIAPNMTKLVSLRTDTNKGALDFSMSLNSSDGGEGFNVTASGKAEGQNTADAASAELTLTLNNGSDALFNNSRISAVISDSTVYIKTDAINQLAASTSEPALKAAAALISGDTWYKVDLNRLLGSLGLTEDTLRLFNTAMQISADADMSGILKSGVSLEGDADFMDTVTLAAMLDMYEELDKYITVTDKGNGAYSASINIQPEDFANIINAVLGGMMTEEEKSSVLNNANYKITAGIDSDGTKVTSNADLDIKINAGGTTFNLKAAINETAEKDGSTPQISVPSASTDITDTVAAILSAK